MLCENCCNPLHAGDKRCTLCGMVRLTKKGAIFALALTMGCVIVDGPNTTDAHCHPRAESDPCGYYTRTDDLEPPPYCRRHQCRIEFRYNVVECTCEAIYYQVAQSGID